MYQNFSIIKPESIVCGHCANDTFQVYFNDNDQLEIECMKCRVRNMLQQVFDYYNWCKKTVGHEND